MPLFLDGLRKAAALNSAGVTFLYQPGKKSCDLALRYFKESLHVLKDISCSEHALPQSIGVSCKSRILTDNQMTIPEAEQSFFHVYSQPKLFFPSLDFEAIDATLLRYTTAVLFNTSLAYQVRSMIDTAKRSKCHSAAQRLYTACSHLCSKYLKDNGVDDNEDLLVLYMASTNNLAQIQIELVQDASFKTSLQELKQIMAHVVSRRQILPEEELDGINEVHLNTVLDQPLAASAA